MKYAIKDEYFLQDAVYRFFLGVVYSLLEHTFICSKLFFLKQRNDNKIPTYFRQ